MKVPLENDYKMFPLRRHTPPSGLIISGHLFEVCGLDLSQLFGAKRVAWRAVETVTDEAIEVLLGGDSIWVWCHLLPPNLQAGQWLRFELRPPNVLVRVDLQATVRGESRLTNLFEFLTAQPGSVAI